MRLGTKTVNPTRIAVCATRDGLLGPWQGSIWYTEDTSASPIADTLWIQTGWHFRTAKAAIAAMELMLADYFDLPKGR